MCFYTLCQLSNHIALDKKVIFCLLRFPQVVQKQTLGDGQLNSHLMASCVRNILTKNYQNLVIGFQVTVENVKDVFLRHSVVCWY